jgi:hypothetical protein
MERMDLLHWLIQKRHDVGLGPNKIRVELVLLRTYKKRHQVGIRLLQIRKRG